MSGSLSSSLSLTDDSKVLTTPVINTTAGRRFDIISGSAGSPSIDYQKVGGKRYGFIYPDAGVMILGENVAHQTKGIKSGSMGAGENIAPSASYYNSSNGDHNQLYPYTGSTEDGKNALRFVNCMKNVSGPTLTLNGEKEVTEVIYVCRIGGNDFNFTNNFTILSGSGRRMFSPDRGVMHDFSTGFTSSAFLEGGTTSQQVSGSDPIITTTLMENGQPFEWPGENVSTMHGEPHTFITGIQLFDQHGEMLAIANPSKPIKKNNDREVIIKVKFTF